MCCESCSKWQHIACHDAADKQAGRHKRNWEKVEFVCRQCRIRQATLGVNLPHQLPGSQTSYPDTRAQQMVHGYQNAYLQPHHYSQPVQHHQGFIGHHESYGVKAQVPVPMADSRTLPPLQAQYPSQKAISFAHYQPHQRGFTTAYESMAYEQQQSGAPRSMGTYPDGVTNGSSMVCNSRPCPTPRYIDAL